MSPAKRRSQAAIAGEHLARQTAIRLGQDVRAARTRRRLTQQGLAEIAGLSRQRLGDVEFGMSLALPMPDWFAIAKALGLYLRFEFGRDPRQELRDAGHLDIQELVVRMSAPAGWKAEWESRSGSRSIDVRLEDHERGWVVIVECWNTFGDLGEAIRSSDYKVRDAEQGGASVGLVWVIRDTRANRLLVGRYARLLESKLSGSSVAWLRALRDAGAQPTRPGLIWCDVKATRLFARRRA